MPRKPLLPEWRYWPALAFAAPIAVAAYSASLSESKQPNQSNYKTADKTDLDGPLSDFWHWVTKDSISFFTFVLALVAGSQGGLILWQIILTRNEFIATHRPRLFVQNVVVTHGTDRLDHHIPARCLISVVNGGETRCRITEWHAAIYYHGENAMFIPHGAKTVVFDPQDGRDLLPGQFGRVELEQPADGLGKDYFDNGSAILYVIGCITYEGDDKIPRVTGFCRRYSQSTGRWAADISTEYEYAY
jgi:hypothetical protein